MRAEFGFYDQGDTIPGANSLLAADKDLLKNFLPKIEQDNVSTPPKKVKVECKNAEEEKVRKAQNEEMFLIKNHLKKLKKKTVEKNVGR